MDLGRLARLDCLLKALRRLSTSDYAAIAEPFMEILIIFAELELPQNPNSKYWKRVLAEILFILRGIEAGGNVHEEPLSGPHNFILSYIQEYTSWNRILLIKKNHPEHPVG